MHARDVRGLAGGAGFSDGEIQGTFLVSGLILKDDAESLVQYLKPFIQTEVEMQKTTKGAMHMAKSVNKVILLGNVGKDPEIRSTPGGATVASFTLATSDRQMDAQGNWTDKTEWHNLMAFQRTAETVRDYVKKGSKLYVEGKIQTRSWDAVFMPLS